MEQILGFLLIVCPAIYHYLQILYNFSFSQKMTDSSCHTVCLLVQLFLVTVCPLLFIICMYTCVFMASSHSVIHPGIFVFFIPMQKRYRQDVSALKFTSVEDTPEMVQAKVSNKLAVDVSSAVVCAHSYLFNAQYATRIE